MWCLQTHTTGLLRRGRTRLGHGKQHGSEEMALGRLRDETQEPGSLLAAVPQSNGKTAAALARGPRGISTRHLSAPEWPGWEPLPPSLSSLKWHLGPL